MKVNRSVSGKKYGFTLLEVVVAITIFGLCISLVYVLYNSVTSIVTSVERQAERDSTAKTVLDRLSEDLAAVYVGKQGYVFAEQPGGFSTEDPVLDITTTAHLRLDPEAPPVDVALVRYYLREQPDADTFSLLRSDTPVMADIENSGLPEQQKHLMSDEVLKLEIVYIGQDGEEYSEWDSVADFDAEQENDERFPQAYNILLSLGTDGEDKAAFSSYQASVRAPRSLIEFEGDQ
jgi:prepilin-type N-terminal cleavage/methylation domain-containing protein